MPDDRLKNYAHLHLIVFIWGFTAVLGALISIESVPLVWYRMSIASLLIYLFMLWRKIPFQLTGPHAMTRKRLMMILAAGVVIALHWITFFGAIKVANVSVTLAMMSTGAFFTSLLEPVFTHKKFVWYEAIFGLLIIAALYYIFQVETQYVWGMLLGLSSAFLSAVFSIMNVQFAREHHPATISFYELLSGVVFLSLFFVVLPFDFVAPLELSASDWLWLFVLSSICTAYAFIASVKVMKVLSAYTVMLTTNLEPVYGIVLAFLVLGDQEQMTSSFYIGAVVILLVILANGFIKTKFKSKY